MKWVDHVALTPWCTRVAMKRAGNRDETRYSRFHPSNFLAHQGHHMARIVTAAVYVDAEHIADGIDYLKQRAHDLALDDDVYLTINLNLTSKYV